MPIVWKTHQMIQKTIRDHKRIIFNGNGYEDAWIREATEERDLLNLRTTPDALPMLLKEKNVRMLTAHKIMSETEIHSRYEITLENYCKTVNIEAKTMVAMARKEILPAVEGYLGELAGNLAAKLNVIQQLACSYEKGMIDRLSALTDEICTAANALETTVNQYETMIDVTAASCFIRDCMLQKMAELRIPCDEAETLTAQRCWPFPTYGELLFGVR